VSEVLVSEDPVQKTHALLGELFRRQAGQLVATLTRIFGPAHLDLAESVVQEALLSALQTWPYQGIPDNPGGWLMRVARNKATDALRHGKLAADKEPELGRFFDGAAADGAVPLEGALRLSRELGDDRLRLLFVCCHPALAQDAQVPLALKTLFGLGSGEIAAAFLTQEATIAQRIVRAKRRIADAGLRFEFPEPDELPARLEGVIETLYLLFNEGYNAHAGDEHVRTDICLEALRLTRLLAGHEVGRGPRTDALAALMCFQASRLDARVDGAGDILLLEDQDRSRWDQRLIAEGARHLLGATQGEALTSLHLQAGIGACHALAPSYAETDWGRIVAYYDDLLALDPSPVAGLNRAAAVAMAEGPEAGLAALKPLKAVKALQSYFLLHGIEAELLTRAGRGEDARTAWHKALALGPNAAERRWIERRLARL
jgi:RNA polymerase sigma-70 factor (ECF subfamily)